MKAPERPVTERATTTVEGADRVGRHRLVELGDRRSPYAMFVEHHDDARASQAQGALLQKSTPEQRVWWREQVIPRSPLASQGESRVFSSSRFDGGSSLNDPIQPATPVDRSWNPKVALANASDRRVEESLRHLDDLTPLKVDGDEGWMKALSGHQTEEAARSAEPAAAKGLTKLWKLLTFAK